MRTLDNEAATIALTLQSKVREMTVQLDEQRSVEQTALSWTNSVIDSMSGGGADESKGLQRAEARRDT